MQTKLTLNQISKVVEILSSITVDNFKINYWISRNLSNLEESHNFMIRERNKIYNDYLTKDEEGNYITVDEQGNLCFHLKEKTEKFVREFNNKINELFNLECEVDTYLIDVETLIEKNISLTPTQISCVRCLLSE